jgi:hypothetical protein
MTVFVYEEFVSAGDATDWIHGNVKYRNGSSVGRDYMIAKVTGTFTGDINLETEHQFLDVSANPVLLNGPSGDVISEPGDYTIFINGQMKIRLVADSTFSGTAAVGITSGSTPAKD